MGRFSINGGKPENRATPEAIVIDRPVQVFVEKEVVKEIPVEVVREIEKIVYVDRIVEAEPVVITKVEVVEIEKPVEKEVVKEIRVPDIMRTRLLTRELEQEKRKNSNLKTICWLLVGVIFIMGVTL